MTHDLAPYGSAGSMTAALASRVRWLRGRCLVLRDMSEVREHTRASGIIVPDRTLYDEHAERNTSKAHRGRVIAHGPPATLKDGTPVPWGIEPGETVLYVYGLAMQKTRTFEDVDGGELVVVGQEEIQCSLG